MAKRIIIIFILIFVFAPSVDAAFSRWQNPRYLKTYVQANHKYTKMMKSAFSRWTQASNGKVVFYYVNNPRIAQITVSFTNYIPESETAIGLESARISRSGRRLRSHIYIAEESFTYKNYSQDEIFTAMLHEIGHCLGLKHDRNKLSIMYPRVDVKQEILKSDIDNLYRIYNIK